MYLKLKVFTSWKQLPVENNLIDCNIIHVFCLHELVTTQQGWTQSQDE